MTIRDASVAFAGNTVRNNASEPPLLLLPLPSDGSVSLLPAASSGKEKVRLKRFDTCKFMRDTERSHQLADQDTAVDSFRVKDRGNMDLL